MELIDTHCHIDVEEFDPDREAILARCLQSGVSTLVVPGYVARGWRRLLSVCVANPMLRPALGLHPIYLAEHRWEEVEQLAEWVERHRPVAIGEIGLDYFVGDADREGQQRLFEAQLRVARRFDLPVLLHVRKAHDQVLATLRRLPVRGGIAHAFNGSHQQACHYLALGIKLGFGGVMTYERAQNIRRLARDLPLDAIVLETDAPDLTPALHKGERNTPEHLPLIAATLAQLRGRPTEEIARITSATARAVLGLPALLP